jgi:hypothetical protein
MSACIFTVCICPHTSVYVPQARSLQAVPRLVKLFNHANQEVQRHATGAMRNLIYDNVDNKLALVEENGIFELLRTLREQDDELRKNVTGTLVPLPLILSPSSALALSCLHRPLIILPSLPPLSSAIFILCLFSPILHFWGALFKFLAVVAYLAITWWTCMYSTASMWRSEDNFGQFSPSTLGSGDQTQVVGLVQKAPLPAEPFCQPIE